MFFGFFVVVVVVVVVSNIFPSFIYFSLFYEGVNGISSPIFLSMKMSILQIEVSSWEYEDDLDTKKDRTRSFLVSIQKALEWYCHNLLIKLCTVFFLLVMRMLFWEGMLTTLLFRSYCNFFPIRLSFCHPPFPSQYPRCHGEVLLKSGSAFYHYEGFQVLLALLEVLRPFN